MLTTLTWIRNILTLFGLSFCVAVAFNIYFQWFQHHWSYHYLTITPFVLAFNVHVILVFLSYWTQVFEDIRNREQSQSD